MNYGYEGANLSHIIKKYDIIDNKIVITFLDGHHREEPLTKQNEQKVLEEMLFQARDRSNSQALDEVSNMRKDELRWLMAEAGFTILAGLSACLAKQEWLRISAMILGGFAGGMTANWVLSYRRYNEVVKELVKYDIYLSMRQQLEENKDLNAFNGINNPHGLLNINTLDNYSLKEIKRIQNNLDMISQANNQESSNQLVKKISK